MRKYIQETQFIKEELLNINKTYLYKDIITVKLIRQKFIKYEYFLH